MTIVNSSGELVTDDQWKAATEHCRREDLILIPSRDGLPFQLSIRYGTRTPIGNTNFYIGEKNRQYEVPVFVAYNFFSLQANKVIYDAKRRTIEASGNVVAVNDSGSTQRSDSMAFKIKDGQVVLFR
jgi:lipopolysaccharide assembly outer membrane protein LptD (OstA)